MIEVRDAHLNNLRHVDVDLPREQLVAVTGVSGSGKSSLAFGTIHGEAQRRYLESVAPFARRLIASAVDPQVGSINGLPPTVALEQSKSGGSVRSTVGTFSTLSNSVRLLYSRCGHNPEKLPAEAFSPNTAAGMCPVCQGAGVIHEPTEATMVPDPNLSIDDGAIAAWPGAWAGKNFHDILVSLGYPVDIPWKDIPAKDREWILFTHERPVVTIAPIRGADQVQRTYKGTWKSVSDYLTDTLKETNSESTRNRVLRFMDHRDCQECDGRKLNRAALEVTYRGLPIDKFTALPLSELTDLLGEPESEAERILLGQVTPTVAAAIDLGIGHLSLVRPAETLSAGELQRLRLASQLHSGLFGVVYVLDEPSAGLHPEERFAVLNLMRDFLAAGNSVILVEHDMNLVAEADWFIDVDRGVIAYSGNGEPADTPTGRALRAAPPVPNDAPRSPTGTLTLRGLHQHNLQDIDVDIPMGSFTAITGVSGSGKSTLINEIDTDERLVHITQKPIGRTPRSTVATYTNLFDKVRKLFASTDEAKARDWGMSRFSYNNAEGRCPTCKGEGKIEVELIFLPGSYTTCPDCHGSRYNDETLEVKWEGYSIADILALTVDEAAGLDLPQIRSLAALGLGYLKLGQGAPELSGGEAQRIKLVTELQRGRGRTVYVLDEPTTGLHPADVDLLTAELNRLVDAGNTVIVVEHNMSVVAQADHVIEMGPGAGVHGGQVMASGTPADVAKTDTPTGRSLMRQPA